MTGKEMVAQIEAREVTALEPKDYPRPRALAQLGFAACVFGLPVDDASKLAISLGNGPAERLVARDAIRGMLPCCPDYSEAPVERRWM